jgi:hypothetical protein
LCTNHTRWEPVRPDRTVTGADGPQAEDTGSHRVWFVHNWSSEAASVAVPSDAQDLVSGDRHAAGTTLSLEPWASLVLAEEDPRR